MDFSSSSAQVLAHASKLATATGARLTTAHVISESGIRDWEKAMNRSAPVSSKLTESSEQINELVAEFCHGVPSETEVRVGNPQRVLSEIVRDVSADLLVLGAHDVSRARLGSVASRCARTAPADVLLLRDWQALLFSKVATCVDFSPQSAVALERAITFAEAHDASLEIIHVIFPPTRDPWGKVMDQPMDSKTSYESAVRERARNLLDSLLEPFAGRLSHIHFERTILESESPAAAITAHVEAAEINLTVLGSRDGSWFSEFVLGSNTERLLHDSSSSILIVRG